MRACARMTKVPSPWRGDFSLYARFYRAHGAAREGI
jgi:hypothetical protein